MLISEIELSILLLGTEDYTGLWDGAHEVGAAFPDYTLTKRRQTAGELLLNLARHGYIEFFRVIGSLASGEISVIPVSEWESILEDSQFWDAPDGPMAESIWFLTTEAGEAVYRAAARSGPDRKSDQQE